MLENRLPFLLSLVLLFCLWKEVQGRCSCPNNGCPQTGMSEGKCYRARYYSTSYQTSYYVTTYYQGTRQGSSTYRCGSWFRRRRCTRYHTNYHQESRSSLRYATRYRSNRACDGYCCTGYRQDSNGRCIVVTCSLLSIPTNGRRSSSRRNYNDRVSFSCNTGYNLRGSSSRTCQSTGQWSGTQPTCNVVPCSSLPIPTNGRRLSSRRNYNDRVSFSCNTGYNLRGSSSRTCQSTGQWSGTQPTCHIVTCSLLPIPTNGHRLSSRRNYNDKVSFSCNTGYNLRGSSSRTCQSNGQWSGTQPMCHIVTCSLLPMPTNGHRLSSRRNYNDRVSFSCNTGYNLRGSSSRTCQSTGQWSGTQPTCHIVTCSLLPMPTNGQSLSSRRSYNDRVSFSCNTGYNLSGSSSRTCQSNGQWSGTQPTCNIVTCSLLPMPTNGQRSSSRRNYNERVSFSCNTGYNLRGSSSRTCQSTGQWSGTQPTCNIVTCSLLPMPTNGQRLSSRRSYNDRVSFSCNTGYTLSGSRSRTCQSNGQWSGTQPTCHIVNCSMPSRPDNGQFYYVGRSYNHRVNFSCNPGYRLTGTSPRTCQSNGQWSGTQPSCNPLPTIVWFTETYHQVKKKDEAVTICLKRNRNLHQEDTVSVVTVNHGEDSESGNFTDTLSSETLVIFEVGSLETCFNFSFVVTNDALDSEHLTLSIMNTTSRTEVKKGSGTVVIQIVDKDSPCPAAFLFAETPVNSQAEFPCSLLDDSFLPGGVITAQCSENSTWEALDMSQCTFRNDVQVATVAVVEVLPSSAMQEETIEGILESLPQVTNVSKIQSTSHVYAIRANSEIDEGVLRRLQSMATTVLLARKADHCNCCGYSAIKIQPIFVSSASFDVCIGSYEAPQACSCSAEGLECFPRFSLSSGSMTGARCYLDADGDGKLDMQDPCVGCCLPDFDRTFQWPKTPHNTIAELPCSIIHSSFSDTNVQRKCLSDDSWEPADISSCTFKNTTRNPIYLLTTNTTLNSEKNSTETIEAIKRAFEKQINKLAEKGETLTNSSYEITTTTITNGANESIVLLVVEFQPSVNLTENTTAITTVTDPFNGATYTITKIIAARPSESCSCRAGASQVAHLCVGPSSSPCDCNSFQTCECIDPYVKDATNGECSLDTDGDSLPDYRDSCPDRYGPVETGGCPTAISSSLVVKCPMEQDKLWEIQWPFAAPGSTQSVRCPGEGDASGLGLAHRSCLAGGMWDAVDVTACESPAVREVRIETKNLLTDLNQTIAYGLPILEADRAKVESISVNLRDALNQSRDRSVLPTDLETAASFVEIVANLSKNNGLFDDNTQEIEKTQQRKVMADIVSSLLEEKNAPAFETNTKSSASRILKATEGIANAITSSLNINKPNVTISRRNLGLHGTRLSFNNVHTRGNLRFPDTSVKLPEFGRPANIPHIKLPAAFISAASRSRGEALSGENGTMMRDTIVEVVNVVMNNIEDYLPDTASDDVNESGGLSAHTMSVSLVISSQISGYDGREFTMDTNESVELTFPIKEEAINAPVPAGYVKQFHCAFFNFTGAVNSTGAWSYRGMRFIDFNGTHVQCKASHLTSFAVLVSIVPSEDLPPLDYITYIGCSISFLCLIGAIIFFLSLRKELIQKVHNFVHLNLCIALALGLFLFLTGVQTATANVGACKFVTALLHYFFMATFTWTLCEAVLVYNLLVKVFGANDKKWIYIYLALGWAVPIPIVIISAASRNDHYLIRHSHDEDSPHYNKIKACWLPTDKGMIFAFVVPMIAIIVVNGILLTISLVSLAKSQCGNIADSKNDKQTQQYLQTGKHLLKATVILVPLLGFTWIIGLFAVGAEGRVFAYLFVIANVFQGTFIFLLHVVRHEKVWGKIKARLPKLKIFTSFTEFSGFKGKTTATFTRSSGKPDDFNSKSSVSTHSTAANVDWGAELEYSKNDQGTRMLELMSSTVDDAAVGNEYDTPSSVAATYMLPYTGEALNEAGEPVYSDVQ